MDRYLPKTILIRPGSSRRGAWKHTRQAMEANLCGLPSSVFSTSLFRSCSWALAIMLRMMGLYPRGIRNALDIGVERLDLWFSGLPEAFDGYKILHISDTHFDVLEGTFESLCRTVSSEIVDLCVITGDYCDYSSTPLEFTVETVRSVCEKINSNDGFVSVLGNHDSIHLVDSLEKLGIHVLANETITLQREGSSIHLTGVDDIHTFCTPDSIKVLRKTGLGFKILLVHSAEIADLAANAGYALYLTGHSHGGQVCLPGGYPLFTGLRKFRSHFRGIWRQGKMIGYTSPGIGVSNIPVRYNAPAKVAVLTLHRDESGNNIQ